MIGIADSDSIGFKVCVRRQIGDCRTCRTLIAKIQNLDPRLLKEVGDLSFYLVGILQKL